LKLVATQIGTENRNENLPHMFDLCYRQIRDYPLACSKTQHGYNYTKVGKNIIGSVE